MDVLLRQYGFGGDKKNFKISLALRLTKPKMLDQTFWTNGYVNYFF